MTRQISKIKWFPVIFLCLMALFLAFPKHDAHADLADKVLGALLDGEKIGDEFFQTVVDDMMKDGIGIVGFEKQRFDSQEDEIRYKAAIITQQAVDYFSYIGNAKGISGKYRAVKDFKNFVENNASNAATKVNKKIEQAGGDIKKVKLVLDDASFLGIDFGKMIYDKIGKMTEEEMEKVRKMDEQLTREAYAELGVDGLPQKLLDELFIMSSDYDSFMKAFENLDKKEKDFLKDSKANFAYSAQLSDEAIAYLDMAGIGSLEDLVKVAKAQNIKSMGDLSRVAEKMAKARADLKSHLDDYVRTEKITNKGKTDPKTMFQHFFDNEILGLIGGLLNGNPSQYNATQYRVIWDPPAMEAKFKRLVDEFEKAFGISFLQFPSNIQDSYNFYQVTKDSGEAIKEINTKKLEHHTFISKVRFVVTKKTGSIGKMDIAPQKILEEIAMEYSPTFAKAYKKITGSALPKPKLIEKKSSYMVVEMDFLAGIKNAKKNSYYDAVRNNWSEIFGGHKRDSLVYDSKKNGFVPTMAFSNVSEKGVYVIEATIYATRYYHKPSYYNLYVGCEDIDTDGDGKKEHKHGKLEPQTYYKYRHKKPNNSNPTHYKHKNNDTQNIKPDIIVADKIVGHAIWEVNVSGGGDNPPPPNPPNPPGGGGPPGDDPLPPGGGGGGTNPPGCVGPKCPPKNPTGKWVKEGVSFIIPPYGVDSKDIRISNFISE